MNSTAEELSILAQQHSELLTTNNSERARTGLEGSVDAHDHRARSSLSPSVPMLTVTRSDSFTRQGPNEIVIGCIVCHN